MENIIKSLIIIIPFALSTSLNAQDKVSKIDTAEFKVQGVCNMCKARIENAALVKGVKFAEWNKETNMLKVVYVNNKTNEENIHKAVADHGHDTEKVKASNEAYQKLPDCCAYRDGVKIH